MENSGSFEEELLRLRRDVKKMCDSHLDERYHFYIENLLKTRLLINTVDTVCSPLNELATDLFNEQRWCILVEVCEAEIMRRVSKGGGVKR